MSKVADVFKEAEAFLGSGIDLSRLDQIYDLQRLLGAVVAYKVLLGIAVNGADAKERRMAAAKLLDSTSEPPEQIVERLRSSIFQNMSLQELEAIIQTGITDPAKAVQAVRKVDSQPNQD